MASVPRDGAAEPTNEDDDSRFNWFLSYAPDNQILGMFRLTGR